MKSLFFLLSIFALSLEACPQGYQSCQKKIIDSLAIENQKLNIPVTKETRLTYSKTPPKNMHILKHDPFLSLYLFEAKQSFSFPFKVNRDYKAPVAIVDEKNFYEGKILKHQIGLNSLAIFSKELHYPSILSNSCAFLEGVVTPDGIIEKEYIERFLKSENVIYSDIGIRVHERDGLVIVSSYNPFLKNSPFKIGDVIIKLNNHKVKSAADFMREILFSKVQTLHSLQIKRSNKILNFQVKTDKRYGGGSISDTYLEQKGFYFDDSLRVIKLEKKALDYGVSIGDKIVQVNGVKIKNEQELRENISNYEEFSFLLFERNSFQFFVKIN